MSSVPSELSQLVSLLPVSQERSTSSLPVDQIVQATVLKALGDNLFSIGIGNTVVTAKSAVDLQQGERLSVAVSRSAEGAVTLKLVTANAVDPSARVALSSSASPEGSVAPSPLSVSAPRADAEQATLERRLLESVPLATGRSAGPVEELLARRPDLAGRVEQLTESFASRPASVGSEIETLRAGIAKLVEKLPASVVAPVVATFERIQRQVLSAEQIAQPAVLGNELAARVPALGQGFEGAVARWIAPRLGELADIAPETAGEAKVSSPADPPTPPAPTPLAPTPSAPSILSLAGPVHRLLEALRLTAPASAVAQTPVPTGATSALPLTPAAPSAAPPAGAPPTSTPLPTALADSARASTPGVANPAAGLETARDDAKSLSAELSATVRKILDVDLKGQLLELRSQLSTLANSSPDQASTVQQAIARVDQIIDPFAAQQLRNVTGMQQFVHVDLPVDPKSGVEEARLQVFYRQRGQGTDGDEDDRFTVAILLKLSQLGDVLATVTGIDGTVSVGFTVDRPTAEDPLAASIDELRAGLTEAGHQGAAISVRRRERASAEADPGMWEEFLELEPLGVDAGGRLDRQA